MREKYSCERCVGGREECSSPLQAGDSSADSARAAAMHRLTLLFCIVCCLSIIITAANKNKGRKPHLENLVYGRSLSVPGL